MANSLFTSSLSALRSKASESSISFPNNHYSTFKSIFYSPVTRRFDSAQKKNVTMCASVDGVDSLSSTSFSLEMELENGVQRWIVDISNWNPSPRYFSFAMSFLPKHEYSSITRFVKLGDQKRALVSKLLQYALVHQVLGIPFDEIIIRRTPEGKPYLVCDEMKLPFPNFNFNASHHGDYVAIASEPICLVGLDIVSHSVPRNETAHEFIQNFSSYFSSSEWNHVMHAGSSDEMLHIFYRYWCLKEAFVKAMGIGVGYKLDDVEFHHTNWNNIFVKVAGKELKDWKFWLLDLGRNHSVCIARGHPRTATTSYRTTLKQIEFDDKEYYNGLHLPNASFTFRTVEDLIKVIYGADQVPFDISTKCDVPEDEGNERVEQ